MSRQFLRQCLVTLGGSSSISIPGGGLKDLRVEFVIGASALQTPNPARARITNPNPQTIASFQDKEFVTLTIEGGYQDNVGLLYSGEIKQSIYVHAENVVDSYIGIFCAEHTNAYQQSHVNKTLAAGWKPMDKVQLALDAMAPFGITGLGLVNVDLSQPARPRGRAIVGMARDVLREVSLSLGAVWSMHRGLIHIINHKQPLQSDGPVVLNSQTGLVGFVHQTESGIIARCLINPTIDVNTQVQIDESSIIQAERDNTLGGGFGNVGSKNIGLNNTGRIASDGLYRVAYWEVEADTRGQAWYMTLTCLATGATLNKGQIDAGLGVGLY